MNSVSIHKVHELEKAGAPLFDELQKTLEQIRQRAFDLFQQRGAIPGSDLDDWFRAEREVLWAPRSELTESAHDYILRIAAPGLEGGDVKVTATPQTIVVRGKAVHKHNGSDRSIWFCEFGEKLFRRFDVPDRIDLDRVTATLDKGILRIVAAKDSKHEERRDRPVSVQAQGGAAAHT